MEIVYSIIVIYIMLVSIELLWKRLTGKIKWFEHEHITYTYPDDGDTTLIAYNPITRTTYKEFKDGFRISKQALNVQPRKLKAGWSVEPNEDLGYGFDSDLFEKLLIRQLALRKLLPLRIKDEQSKNH